MKNRKIKLEPNKNKKLKLINNLYGKPIVYFDNLSININNINVHQKAYNNTLSAKSKNSFDSNILKKIKNNDYDYRKRNNTINPKSKKNHLNFNDLVIKSESNAKSFKERINSNKMKNKK